MLKKTINFGTDGWRGVIGEDFTFENLGRLAGRIIAYMADKGKKVCIGYDNRFLSPEYADFFAAALEKSGLEVDLSGQAVTTPCVSHRTNRKGYDLGIMITASHNPPHYNGIKFKESYGGSASTEVVNDIIRDLDKMNYEGETTELAFQGNPADWGPEYEDEFIKILPAGDLKVVCDFMHGTGYPSFENILKKKGYDIVSLRQGRDPLFGGINPEPKPAALGELARTVKETNADIGFAFDGDGDRIAAVDEKGRLLSSQVILSVIAYDMLEQGKKGAIVKTVAGTYLIDRMAKKYNIDFRVVPIGFKNICPEILKGGVLAAGEESGGIGFGDYLPERDAVNTAVRIIEIIRRRGRLMGELWDDVSSEFGGSCYLREDFEIPAGGGIEKMLARIKDGIKKVRFPYKITDILELDGIRINMEEERWLLLRPSGTEPALRLYAETESEKSTKKLLEIGKELI
ncbi:MAG: hypothetical protein ABIH89_07190 [Elusimicrobiota bacterium]